MKDHSALPTIDRISVARPAVALASALAAVMDLSPYRLAGGTALAWALGHRLSEDLDFFTRVKHGLGPAEQATIAEALQRLDPSAGIDISQARTVHAVVLGCKISFFELDGRWLSEGQPVQEGLHLATLDEIAAMKLVAVGTRSTKKDFIDLHVLVKHGYTAVRMYDCLWAMYPGDVTLQAGRHLVQSLAFFDDAETDPDPVMRIRAIRWSDAKRTARGLSEELKAHLASRKHTKG